MWAHYAEKHYGMCPEFEARTEQVGRAYRVLQRTHFRSLDRMILAIGENWWMRYFSRRGGNGLTMLNIEYWRGMKMPIREGEQHLAR